MDYLLVNTFVSFSEESHQIQIEQRQQMYTESLCYRPQPLQHGYEQFNLENYSMEPTKFGFEVPWQSRSSRPH